MTEPLDDVAEGDEVDCKTTNRETPLLPLDDGGGGGPIGRRAFEPEGAAGGGILEDKLAPNSSL